MFVKAMSRSPLIMFTVERLLQAQACSPVAGQRSDRGGNNRRTRFDGRWRVCRRVNSVARSGVAHWEPGIENVSLEAELKDDICPRIMIVVDFDLIHNRWVERKIVRPIAGLKKWVDVQDKGDAIWMIVADKRIEIGDISGVIQCGDWCFPMARCKHPGRHSYQQTQCESGCGLQF